MFWGLKIHRSNAASWDVKLKKNETNFRTNVSDRKKTKADEIGSSRGHWTLTQDGGPSPNRNIKNTILKSHFI